MRHMLIPQREFACPGCANMIPAGWKRGIGFNDDGILLCANCLKDEIDDAAATIAASLVREIERHDTEHDTASRGVRSGRRCKECNLIHRGEC